MQVISLQSGSNGNCIYIETKGVRLLFDAGISGKRALERLADYGRDIRDVDAVIISHDHHDHVGCAGIYQRKFKLPIHLTEETYARATSAGRSLGALTDVSHFEAGEALRFGEVTVETVPTPHDASASVAFIVDDGERRLGILTDLGHVFDRLVNVLATLDAVIIESNYDDDMLAASRYPASVKNRIKGPGGHISNTEAALLLNSAGADLQWACLGHLSQECNSPPLAIETHRRILGGKLPIHLAGRHAASEVMTLR